MSLYMYNILLQESHCETDFARFDLYKLYTIKKTNYDTHTVMAQ